MNELAMTILDDVTQTQIDKHHMVSVIYGC